MKLSEKGLSKFWKTFNYKTGIELYPSETDELDEAIANHEFEPDHYKDIEKEFSKFFFKLMEEQRPVPADMARLLNDHFWELG